jgi:hypothetical protein
VRQRTVFRLRHLGATQHDLLRGVRRGVRIGRGDRQSLGLGFAPSKAGLGFASIMRTANQIQSIFP